MSASIVRLDAAGARPRRVAVGKFDGLHLGHRAVISGCDAVCTFDPHPSAVLSQGPPPPLLTSLRRRAELLGATGVEELVVLPFDKAMRARSPQAFIEDVLHGALGATHVHVGASFRFGHRAAGRPADLLADGRLRCRVVEPVLANGAAISSTRIRALVAAGAMAEAAELLGAPHAVWCRRASTGPDETQLLAPPELALPPAGTYTVRIAANAGDCGAVARCRVTASHEDDGARRLVLEGALDAQELRIAFVERLGRCDVHPRLVSTSGAARR